MSTLRVNTLQDAAGTGQPAMSGAAKAWVNFDGSGTVAIRAAFNVTSITDNGVGDYTLNFTNALAGSDYAVVGSTGSLGVSLNAGSVGQFTTATTTACRIQTAIASGGGRVAGDNTHNGIAVYR